MHALTLEVQRHAALSLTVVVLRVPGCARDLSVDITTISVTGWAWSEGARVLLCADVTGHVPAVGQGRGRVDPCSLTGQGQVVGTSRVCVEC